MTTVLSSQPLARHEQTQGMDSANDSTSALQEDVNILRQECECMHALRYFAIVMETDY